MLKKALKYLLLAGLLYFPLFSHLGVLPIRIWDESRVANNAIEMHDNGDLLVTYFTDEPDHYNTKPPLMVWMQAFWMKILGPNELAVRLPSAISAFLCCLALVFFGVKYLKNFWLGFAAALVLVTCPGFVGQHVSRTGDYDAVLVLFTTLSALSIFLYSVEHRKKWLYMFFLFLFLAVMTKSIVGFMFLPGVLLYFLWKKQVLSLLKTKELYFGLAAFIVLIASYFILRESHDEGYLNAVLHNDLFGRFDQVLENHDGGFWYYYNYLINGQLSYWYLIVPMGWLIGFFHRNEAIKNLTVFTIFVSISYLLFISLAQTKLEWYTAPMIPLLAINVGVAIDFIASMLKNSSAINKQLKFNPTPYFVLFIAIIAPYRKIIAQTFAPEEISWEKSFYQPEYWLRDYIRNNDQTIKLDILRTDYRPHWRFYVKAGQMADIPIQFIEQGDVHASKNLMVFLKEDQLFVESNHKFEIVEEIGEFKRYRILGYSN
jgi:4-amino-4-deoxy-L-arabinose transferase-like glycosyltransferase